MNISSVLNAEPLKRLSLQHPVSSEQQSKSTIYMQIGLYLSATNFNPKDTDQMAAVYYTEHHKVGLMIGHRK